MENLNYQVRDLINNQGPFYGNPTTNINTRAEELLARKQGIFPQPDWVISEQEIAGIIQWMETAESKVNGFWVGMLGRWFPFPAYILAAEARSETANTKSGGGRIDITVTRMRDRHVILHLEGKHDDKVEVIPQLKGYMESAMKVGEDLFGMAVSGRSVQFLGAVEDPTGGMKVVSFVARGGELVQSTQGNGNGAGEWYELGGAHHWAIIGEALRYIAVKTE